MSENGEANERKVRVLSAGTKARNNAHRYYADCEQTNKTNQMQISALRTNGRHSDNLLMRAMQLDRPIFADGSLNMMGASSLSRTSASRHIAEKFEDPVPDMVQNTPGVLLSRGAVPSVIPGKYPFQMPDSKDWSAAATRKRELKQALAALETEIKTNETAVFSQTKFTVPDPKASAIFAQDPNRSTAKFTQVIKQGSNVLGSSFKWSGTQSKSVNVEKFAWPQTYAHSFGSWPVGSTKYGMLSHECDVPGGSVFVNKEAIKKKRR